MSNQQQVHPFVPLGIGVAMGAGSLWLAVKLWPAVILGVAAWLITKGVLKQNPRQGGND